MELRPIFSALMRNKTGALLIAAQVALTLAIVTNASNIVSERLATAQRASGVDDENRVLTDRPILASVTNIDALQQRDLAALRAVPGVESAVVTNQVPLGNSGWNSTIADAPRNDARTFATGMYFDGGGLVETLGLKIVEGRDFNPEEIVVIDPEIESRKQPTEVLITRQLAEAMFPGESQFVGRTIYQGNSADADAMRIIGVVDLMQTPWAQSGPSNAYALIQPIRYLGLYSYYVVRAAPGAEDEVRRTMSEALLSNEPERVSNGVRSIHDLRDRRYRGERGVAWLLLAVTGFLLLVTASGIVGMASLWVTQRRKQIGVRRALGATRGDIVRYFVTENLLIALLGVAVGALAARVLNAALMRQLSLTSLPQSYLVVGVAALLVLSLMAVLGPALRASRLSPALATRSV